MNCQRIVSKTVLPLVRKFDVLTYVEAHMNTASSYHSVIHRNHETKLRTITDMKKNLDKKDDEVKKAKCLKKQSPVEEEKPQDSFNSETAICRELHHMSLEIYQLKYRCWTGHLFKELS